MSIVSEHGDFEQLQQENAKLHKQLQEIEQRKHDKAIRKAQAKLAELQEQTKTVDALNAAKGVRAELQQQQLDQIDKYKSHLRLSALELFTGRIEWESWKPLWGPKVKVCLKIQEPGNVWTILKKNFPKGLHLSKHPFAIGGMRLAYYAMGTVGHRFVAKRLLLESAHPQKNIDAFVEDLHTHREAARLAARFNWKCKSAGVDAKLRFGAAYIVEDVDPSNGDGLEDPVWPTLNTSQDEASCAAPSTVLLLEDYLEGKFTKWNTNNGQVCRSDDVIPQAFSHFTYHVTSKEAFGPPKLVVDIQGVANRTRTTYRLTDPAIHCEKGPHSYGETNCGARGIQRFFETHQCNDVCRKLGLPENTLSHPPGALDHVDASMNDELGFPYVPVLLWFLGILLLALIISAIIIVYHQQQ